MTLTRWAFAAAATPTDPHTWALLSKTHIAADRARAAREVNLTQHLANVARDVLARPRRPAARATRPRSPWATTTIAHGTGPDSLENAAAGERHADVMMVHHNPNTGGNKNGLTDTDALMTVLQPWRQVQAHCYGQSHHWQIVRVETGIHLVNLPAVACPFAAD